MDGSTLPAAAWAALWPLLALACSRAPAPPSSGAARPRSVLPERAPADAGEQAAAVEPRPPQGLNLLLITVDCLRADMPWAGYPRPIAPNLTRLEQRAVSYTHAYALSSYTSMSLGGLLGGRYPGEMKRDGYFFGTYRDNVLFPERLQGTGIRTMTVHAHLYFQRAAAGFQRGFDVYELVPGLKWNPTTDENITSPASERIAERLLDDPSNTSGRFFAWVHFLDPHDQYQRHPGVDLYGKKARDLYDGEVTYTDKYIGKLLDFVETKPWGERTAVIVTADHGEAFGEHGQYRHAFELWEPLIRVPLMFVLPGARARRIDVRRSAIDLAPTILELMGVPSAGMEGKSLLREIYGAEEPEPRDVVVDLPRTSNSDRRRALIHEHYKVIAYGDDVRFDVFDLESDPGETTSLRRVDRAKYEELVALYRSKCKEIKDVGPYACRTLRGAPPGRAY